MTPWVDDLLKELLAPKNLPLTLPKPVPGRVTRPEGNLTPSACGGNSGEFSRRAQPPVLWALACQHYLASLPLPLIGVPHRLKGIRDLRQNRGRILRAVFERRT